MAYAVAKPTDIKIVDNQEGKRKERVREVTLTGTYPTGGEPLTARDFGLNQIIDIDGVVTEGASRTALLIPQWNPATGKLQLYGMAAAAGVGTALAEKSNAAYNASTRGRLTVYGT